MAERKREHVWALQWTDTRERERGRLEQTPEAFDVWIGQLMHRLDGRRIGVVHRTKTRGSRLDAFEI
jgi:hypothetical protein